VTLRLKDGRVINQTGVCQATLGEFLDTVSVYVAKGLMIIEGDLRSMFTVRATVERGELAFAYARPNQRLKREPSRRARRQRMIELQMHRAST
jgi:hypothetical protein